MPAKGFLSLEQKRRLQQFLKQSERFEMRERVLILLLMNDGNLIELVWHSCKEYIAHRLFQSVCELKSTLNKLLNDGELIIKWGRRIKNKGNAVCAN